LRQVGQGLLIRDDSSTRWPLLAGRPIPATAGCATVMRCVLAPLRAGAEAGFPEPIKAAPAATPRRSASRGALPPPSPGSAAGLLPAAGCRARQPWRPCAARWPSTNRQNRRSIPLNPANHRENKTLKRLSDACCGGLAASEDSRFCGIRGRPDRDGRGPGSPTWLAAGCWRGQHAYPAAGPQPFIPNRWPGEKPCVRKMAELLVALQLEGVQKQTCAELFFNRV